MTKKDYELLAGVINSTHWAFLDHTTLDQFVRLLAHELQGDNPNFNTHKFVQACLASRFVNPYAS